MRKFSVSYFKGETIPPAKLLKNGTIDPYPIYVLLEANYNYTYIFIALWLEDPKTS